MIDTPPITPKPPRRIEILAFDQVQLLDVAGPLQVFATANDFAVHRGAPAPYDLDVFAPGVVGVATSAGLGLMTKPLPRDSRPLDTLIIAGGWGVNAACEAALLGWLRERAPHARRLATSAPGPYCSPPRAW